MDLSDPQMAMVIFSWHTDPSGLPMAMATFMDRLDLLMVTATSTDRLGLPTETETSSKYCSTAGLPHELRVGAR
jgi:hypothetical protein